jgi:hypothetical protein
MYQSKEEVNQAIADGDLRVIYKHYRHHPRPSESVGMNLHDFDVREYQGCLYFHYPANKDDRWFKPGEKGGVTIAFIFDKEGEPVESGEALCSKQDNFCYHLGRQIALGRAVHSLANRCIAPF